MSRFIELLDRLPRMGQSIRKALPLDTIVSVDKQDDKFYKYCIISLFVTGIYFLVAGTMLIPSVIAMRIGEFLFTTNIHIFILFMALRQMVKGEFERPVFHSVLYAVPVAAVINVLSRFIVSGWLKDVPAFFGHPSFSTTVDWMYHSNVMLLSLISIGCFLLVFVILWLTSNVRYYELISPFVIYILGASFFIYVANVFSLLFSVYSPFIYKWVVPYR